ncbi:hypothetical protein [Chryseobacterium wanjuense]
MESGIRIISKEKGKRLGVAGGNYRVIVSGDDTNQSYAVIEMTVPPGGGRRLILILIRTKHFMYWKVKLNLRQSREKRLFPKEDL